MVQQNREEEKKRLVGLLKDADSQSFNAISISIDYYYEQLADNLLDGGVIVPPCKVGDVVYSIGWLNETVKEEKILYFKYNSYLNNFVFGTDMGHFDANQIGNFIFLNREAAEQALKEKTQ